MRVLHILLCACFSVVVLTVCDNTYRQVLFLLQCSLLLPQPISELINPFVHSSYLQVSLVQALSLMLQFRVLILVELVPQLSTKKGIKTKTNLTFVPI